jgi:hypothetical protein
VLKVLLVVALFAVVTYAVIRLLERRSGPGSSTATGGPSRSRGAAPRQVAPDDDEDFLRWLDRKRRKDPPG